MARGGALQRPRGGVERAELCRGAYRQVQGGWAEKQLRSDGVGCRMETKPLSRKTTAPGGLDAHGQGSYSASEVAILCYTRREAWLGDASCQGLVPPEHDGGPQRGARSCIGSDGPRR